MPATLVLGVIAVLLPVPPVAVVYHLSDVPLALSADAVAYWQYVTGVVTVGLEGFALTFTVIAVRILSPQLMLWLT